jgi:hypothetical protein
MELTERDGGYVLGFYGYGQQPVVNTIMSRPVP